MKLQEGEKILHELRPESNILVIWFFTKCLILPIIVAVPSSFLFGFGISESSKAFVTLGLIFLILAPVALILLFAYCICLKATYAYYITNRRCVFCGGIIHKIQRSAPYHKITDVEMSQNIIERMLGISTINIFTPGTGSIQGSGIQKAEISFTGLKDNETPAETINEILQKFKATGE